MKIANKKILNLKSVKNQPASSLLFELEFSIQRKKEALQTKNIELVTDYKILWANRKNSFFRKRIITRILIIMDSHRILMNIATNQDFAIITEVITVVSSISEKTKEKWVFLDASENSFAVDKFLVNFGKYESLK